VNTLVGWIIGVVLIVTILIIRFLINKKDKKSDNNGDNTTGNKNTEPEQSEYIKENKKKLKNLSATLEQKSKLGKAYNIDDLIKLVEGKKELIPQYLKDEDKLLTYINDQNKAKILNAFLESFEKKNFSFILEELLPTLKSKNEQIGNIHRQLGLSTGDIEGQINSIKSLKEQYHKLEQFDKLKNVKHSNFASICVDKINSQARKVENIQDENSIKVDALYTSHSTQLDSQKKEFENNTSKLVTEVKNLEDELDLRLPNYISGIKLCAESIYTIYQNIKNSSSANNRFIEEMVNPVLVGENGQSGLKGYISKLNNPEKLFMLLEINNWAELKEQDLQKKSEFVKRLVCNNDFFAVIDLVTIFYAYSKIKLENVDVAKDLLNLGINPSDISHAYGILQFLLKQLFDIDIITPNLFKDKFDDTAHQLNTTRRFMTLNGKYRGLEDQLEQKTIFDILQVGLKSNTYNFINRKAELIYK
jgi:hypothetical protein